MLLLRNDDAARDALRKRGQPPARIIWTLSHSYAQGTQGQKRPADTVANAIRVAMIPRGRDRGRHGQIRARTKPPKGTGRFPTQWPVLERTVARFANPDCLGVPGTTLASGPFTRLG